MYGRAKAIAQMYSDPSTPPCQARRVGRVPTARPAVSACCVTLMFASSELLHRDLCEYFAAPLESLIDGVSDLHAVLDHIGMCLAPELLGIGLAPGRRITLIRGQGRIEYAFFDVGLQAWLAAVQPPRVLLDD